MKQSIIKTLKSFNIIKYFCYLMLIFAIPLLILLICPNPHYTDGFKSINNLHTFAQTLDEFIKMENKNVLNPTYEKYYQVKFDSSFWPKFHNKINYVSSILALKKAPEFSPTFFQTILNQVSQERISHKWQGSFIQKIDLSPDSKLIVFGTIQGSFHGMVRYLQQLKELNIINGDLKITNPNYYFVFLGNIVNRSPYTLELLSLVLRLLKNNPNNVICLRGRHEFQTCWKNNTLGREIELVAHQLNCSQQQLSDNVETFFSTLPLKLACTFNTDNNINLNYFELSPFIENENARIKLKNLSSVNYMHFLLNKTEKLETLDLDREKTAINDFNDKPILRALVTDIKKRDTYEIMNGLRLLPPIDSVIAWTIFSTTAESYRKALNFFYDAFVIITPAKELSDWTITLYNRDIREANKLFKTKSYYFFTGRDIGH